MNLISTTNGFRGAAWVPFQEVFCREPQPAKAIMAELGLKHWKTIQANYLAPLMTMGILERNIPDKLQSRMQR